jgi:cell division transport system permease protein
MAQGMQNSKRRPGGSGSLATWIRQHRASVAEAWANFGSDRGVSVLVVGVTFAIPLLLHVAHHNVAAVIAQLGSSAQATLFMDTGATLDDARELAARLNSDPRLGDVTLIDKEAALVEFAENSGLQTMVGTLTTNPLPHTLVVSIKDRDFDALAGQGLESDLRQNPLVEHVELDLIWVQKVTAIGTLVARWMTIFTLILALGVVLITANTVKNGIFSRRAEIEVVKLCGATDSFVRRPFLYGGVLQGLAGAVLAVITVFGAVEMLSLPAETIRSLYDSDVQLSNLSGFSILSALVGGATLGLAGALHSVSVHLRRLDVVTP